MNKEHFKERTSLWVGPYHSTASTTKCGCYRYFPRELLYKRQIHACTYQGRVLHVHVWKVDNEWSVPHSFSSPPQHTVHVLVHVHIHMYMYTYTSTYTHIHVYICTSLQLYNQSIFASNDTSTQCTCSLACYPFCPTAAWWDGMIATGQKGYQARLLPNDSSG